jgi:hypothetical protein
MLRRNRRNLPKFQDFDDIVATFDSSKALYKKKYKIVSPVERSIQNCSQVGGIYVTTDNPTLMHTGSTLI